MIETLMSVLGNSHFEAYIGGPLAGIVVAIFFSALGSKPPTNEDGNVPSPREIRERIIHHHHLYPGGDSRRSSRSNRSGRGQQGDDASGVMIALSITGLVGVFLFSAFLPRIAFAVYFFITSVAVFSLTACVIAIITGRFGTAAWWSHTVFPCFNSLGCLVVSVQAYSAISPEVTRYAQQLLGDGPLTVNLVLNGAFVFFHAMDEYVHLIMFVMLAFACVALSSLITLLQCVHYLALSNAGSVPSSAWRKIASWTERFKGVGTTVAALVLLAVGWFMASGHAYRLLHG